YNPPTPAESHVQSKGVQGYYCATGSSTAANTPDMSSTSSRVTPLAAGANSNMMAPPTVAPSISSIPEFGTSIGGLRQQQQQQAMAMHQAAAVAAS
ncbi:hypothetical protein Pmar_PMAR008363, partial [Perkinsus marinus ATCC 50983]